MSVATRRAIYGRLAGDTTLNGLLATAPSGYSKSIFYGYAPDIASYPFVILHKQSGTPTWSMQSGKSAYDAEVWLVKAVDHNTSADPADEIASRIKVLLTDGALSISGASQMYLRPESDVDYPEEKDGETYVHAGSLFRLLYE